jgi:sugar lactone lactonase YvrE
MIIGKYGLSCLVRDGAALGEGPVWDSCTASLYWVDIEGPTIFRWDEASGAVDRWTPPFQIASLAPSASGGFIAGTGRGFASIDPAEGRYDAIVHPEPDRRGNRFNDGKLDRRGRFWAGTMDNDAAQSSGALYRFDATLQATRVDDGYRIANGPAFDLAGRCIYHTDTARQTVFAFDLDNDGNISAKREFAHFEAGDGYPDGMTVDAEDCLWIAFWGGACVRRLSPSGKIIDEVALPVSQVTSCVFGGSDMATLFVTTAHIGLDRAEHPLAGSLFALRPGVAGPVEVPFAGPLIAA